MSWLTGGERMINRREFLKRTGWTLLGGLLVPYVPKVFYSIPKEIVTPMFPAHKWDEYITWINNNQDF